MTIEEFYNLKENSIIHTRNPQFFSCISTVVKKIETKDENGVQAIVSSTKNMYCGSVYFKESQLKLIHVSEECNWKDLDNVYNYGDSLCAGRVFYRKGDKIRSLCLRIQNKTIWGNGEKKNEEEINLMLIELKNLVLKTQEETGVK